VSTVIAHTRDCVNVVFRLRRMFDVVDLPLRWPAEVNYHEAKAFCVWSGPDFRLMAEAEYHAMRAPPVSDPVLSF